MARRTSLFHTTAIRVALRYAVLYALLIAAGLGVLYWSISRFVDAQIAAGLEQELAHLSRVDALQGRDELIRLLDVRTNGASYNRRYTLLQGPANERLAGSLHAWPPQLAPDGVVRNIWIEDELIPGRLEDHVGFWPMIAGSLPDGSRLLVAQGVRHAEDLQEFILGTMAAILAVSVGLALTMGWLLGRTILHRIEVINDTAGAIGEGNLERRVPLTGRNDEFDQLSHHLNAMLDRIQRLLAGLREVADNVAHDLRRPLSRLRGRLEVSLLEARDEAAYRHALQAAMVDIDDLIRTFNGLLQITQAESGSFRGERGTVDLSGLVEHLGALYRDHAEDSGRLLDVETAPGIEVTGSRHLLGEAISNLLENALHHTPCGTHVTLRARCDSGRVVVMVGDDGPGIPAHEREHVLQRFVRLDNARTTPGNGLGLSLVRAVADLHHASLALEDNHPGLRVTLVFPGNRGVQA